MNTAFALLLGPLPGWQCALARTALDTRLTTAADLDRITELPVLGGSSTIPVLPRIPSRSVPTRRPRNRSRSAPCARTCSSSTSAACPQLRHHELHSGEGKSTVAAQSGGLAPPRPGPRWPSWTRISASRALPRFMGVDGAVGLSNLLAGMVDLEDVMHRWGRLELYVLPSGRIPPNPSELLGLQGDGQPARAAGRALRLRPHRLTPGAGRHGCRCPLPDHRGTILVAAMRTVRRADVAASLDALDGIARRLVVSSSTAHRAKVPMPTTTPGTSTQSPQRGTQRAGLGGPTAEVAR